MLLEYNQLQEFMRPAVGTQLYLKTKSPVRPALASTAAGADDIAFASNRTIAEPSPDVSRSAGQQFITHIVQRKETMYSIAKKYNVKINDLSTWNHLKGNALVPGQKLKIYK
jgi:LysM repeat protein